MLDILGKVLKDKYIIKGLTVDNDYMAVYDSVDLENNNYLIYRLKTEKHSTQIQYNETKQLFSDAKNFIKDNDFDLIPIFEDYIQTDWEQILILKTYKGDSLSYFMSNSFRVNFYHAYMILEPLFNLIEILTLKDIYIKLDNLIVFDTKLRSNDIFYLYGNVNDINISLALIYYKLATGQQFNKYNCHTVSLPKNVISLLANTINNKITFNDVSGFVVSLKKAIQLKKHSSSFDRTKKRILVMFCCFFIFLSFIIFSAKVLYIISNTSNDFTEAYIFDETEYYYEGNDLIVYDDNVYLNSYFEDEYSLMKIGIKNTDKFIITNNLLMEYLVVVNDIIYYSNGSDNGNLYSINLDGSNNKKQTDYPVSYIQKDSSNKYLYFISENEKQEIVYKYNLFDKKRENFIEKINSHDKYLLFIKANKILNEKLMDNFDKLDLEADLYAFNYRVFEDGYLFFDSNTESYDLNKIDKDGNIIVNPFNIKTYNFEVSGDLIYYVDFDDGTLYSYDYKKDLNTKVYGNCMKLHFVSDNKIILEYADEYVYKVVEIVKNPKTNKFDIVNEIKTGFSFDTEKSF